MEINRRDPQSGKRQNGGMEMTMTPTATRPSWRERLEAKIGRLTTDVLIGAVVLIAFVVVIFGVVWWANTDNTEVADVSAPPVVQPTDNGGQTTVDRFPREIEIILELSRSGKLTAESQAEVAEILAIVAENGAELDTYVDGMSTQVKELGESMAEVKARPYMSQEEHKAAMQAVADFRKAAEEAAAAKEELRKLMDKYYEDFGSEGTGGETSELDPEGATDNEKDLAAAEPPKVPVLEPQPPVFASATSTPPAEAIPPLGEKIGVVPTALPPIPVPRPEVNNDGTYSPVGEVAEACEGKKLEKPLEGMDEEELLGTYDSCVYSTGMEMALASADAHCTASGGTPASNET